MNKKALILGVTGQDGAHLAAHLLADGWEVYGGFRRGSAAKLWRLEYLGLIDRIHLVNMDIEEPFDLVGALNEIKPSQIYHLAGESFVADSFFHPTTTFQANVMGTLNVLEAIRTTVPEARLFFASSSEIFCRPDGQDILDEESKLQPSNPYGISKLSAQELVRVYRESYGIFASVGILFNHEGVLRARNFVTRKITSDIARLKIEGGDPIELGDFGASRDWGSAEDFCRAMPRVLELNQPDNFIFATGVLTPVRDFLSFAAIAAGFSPGFVGEGAEEKCIDRVNGRIIAQVSPRYFRAHDTSARRGNSEKLRKNICWQGSRPIELLAQEMVAADIDRWKKGIKNI
jgi:GDPmannose 4,6-dehydratase